MDKQENYEPLYDKNGCSVKFENPPKAIWIPSYLTCSRVIVGNPAPNITVKSRYAVQNLNTSYYTTFKINSELDNE